MEKAVLPANEYLVACWKSSSNIALVKYWGKKGHQIPANPSLSFTLSEAYTVTRLTAIPLTDGSLSDVKFWFEGVFNEVFGKKAHQFIRQLEGYFPFVNNYRYEVESGNNFPHSAGIASSASGMSALALCMCTLNELAGNEACNEATFYQKASHVARIGSGSACRSVYGGFSVWGKTPLLEHSSDYFAVPLPFEVHSVFRDIRDLILLVDATPKKVSSSVGHGLMNGHSFASARYTQAGENLASIIQALQTGDWELFSEITENEALSLHAMMMTSRPGYLLLHPDTIKIIERIREFRDQTKSRVCFTLDAGPNIHLLYSSSDYKQIEPLIEELGTLYRGGKFISDAIGSGPEKLKCK